MNHWGIFYVVYKTKNSFLGRDCQWKDKQSKKIKLLKNSKKFYLINVRPKEWILLYYMNVLMALFMKVHHKFKQQLKWFVSQIFRQIRGTFVTKRLQGPSNSSLMFSMYLWILSLMLQKTGFRNFFHNQIKI